MVVLSPIWLLAAVPLAGLMLWLLLGRRPRVSVPFLPLWEGPAARPSRRRSLQLPPLPIVFALLALIAAVLAAAHIQLGSANRPHVCLIVDRGLSMSARGRHDLRFREATQQFKDALQSIYNDASIELLTEPGGQPRQVTSHELPSVIDSLPPSCIDTRPMLQSAIGQQTSHSSAPVWVISDAVIHDDRIVQVAPDTPLHDVGIVSLAARQGSAAEVMIRIRNDSTLDAADLVVSSGEAKIRRHVRLPAPGQDANEFIQLPQLGTTVAAQLDMRDDVAADKHAWLVSESSSPRIETRSPIPPELQRMIAVYQRARHSGEDAPRLLVASAPEPLDSQRPGVILAPPHQIEGASEPLAASHPITKHVNWSHVPGPLQAAGPPPAGWTPLVWGGRQVLVAVRPQPPNQVWVGFDAPRWNATPDFVIFWTNVFDWAGGGAQSLAAHTLNEWTPDWLPSAPTSDSPAPGLYHRPDGARRAFNAPAPSPSQATASPWRSHLRDLVAGPGRIDLTPWLVLVATALLVLSIALWPTHVIRAR